MDEFYSELYGDLIFEWIKMLGNKNKLTKLTQIEDKTYKKATLKEGNYTGTITLWLNEHIIEEEIRDNENHTVFYLHYNIVSLKQAYYFIHDFFRAFINFLELAHIRILLCCSGGLSTSWFCDNLQSVADSYHFPLSFSATGIGEIKNVMNDYDIILLAPQIAYMHPEIVKQKVIPEQKILCISPNDFATQNYRQLVLEIVDRNLSKKIL